MSKLMLIVPTEDGARISFHDTVDEIVQYFGGEYLPTKWLTQDEARDDPNYWPENSAFLCRFERLELKAKEVVTAWELRQ